MEEVEEKLKVSQSRFRDAPWFGVNKEIIIGGTGSIGSWTALFLARIGHTLNLFDMDTVEEINMAGQFYEKASIGENKAEATMDLLLRFSETESVNIFSEYVNEYSPVMIACFDNMKSRKLMFEAWKKESDREIFIDARLLAEVGMVYFVVPGREAEYEATLFEDSEIADAPCSFKSTSHASALIASFITSGLNNYITNQVTGEDIREFPFEVSFELASFNFVIK